MNRNGNGKSKTKIKANRLPESLCWSCVKARADQCAWIGGQVRIWQRARSTISKVRGRQRNGDLRIREIEICAVQACDSYVKDRRSS